MGDSQNSEFNNIEKGKREVLRVYDDSEMSYKSVAAHATMVCKEVKKVMLRKQNLLPIDEPFYQLVLRYDPALDREDRQILDAECPVQVLREARQNLAVDEKPPMILMKNIRAHRITVVDRAEAGARGHAPSSSVSSSAGIISKDILGTLEEFSEDSRDLRPSQSVGRVSEKYVADGGDEEALLRSVQQSGKKFGLLEKRSKARDTWRERWFVLQDDKLWYCKPQDNERHLSYIPLSSAVRCEMDGDRTFSLHHHHRVYVLRAPSPEEAIGWMEAIIGRQSLMTANDLFAMAETNVCAEERWTAEHDDGLLLRATSFRSAVQLPLLRAKFQEFARDEGCEADLLFWLEAERYRRSVSPPGRSWDLQVAVLDDTAAVEGSGSGSGGTGPAEVARTIYQRFLRREGDEEVEEQDGAAADEESEEEVQVVEVAARGSAEGERELVASTHKQRALVCRLVHRPQPPADVFAPLANAALLRLRDRCYPRFRRQRGFARLQQRLPWVAHARRGGDTAAYHSARRLVRLRRGAGADDAESKPSAAGAVAVEGAAGCVSEGPVGGVEGVAALARGGEVSEGEEEEEEGGGRRGPSQRSRSASFPRRSLSDRRSDGEPCDPSEPAHGDELARDTAAAAAADAGAAGAAAVRDVASAPVTPTAAAAAASCVASCVALPRRPTKKRASSVGAEVWHESNAGRGTKNDRGIGARQEAESELDGCWMPDDGVRGSGSGAAPDCALPVPASEDWDDERWWDAVQWPAPLVLAGGAGADRSPLGLSASPASAPDRLPRGASGAATAAAASGAQRNGGFRRTRSEMGRGGTDTGEITGAFGASVAAAAADPLSVSMSSLVAVSGSVAGPPCRVLWKGWVSRRFRHYTRTPLAYMPWLRQRGVASEGQWENLYCEVVVRLDRAHAPTPARRATATTPSGSGSGSGAGGASEERGRGGGAELSDDDSDSDSGMDEEESGEVLFYSSVSALGQNVFDVIRLRDVVKIGPAVSPRNALDLSLKSGVGWTLQPKDRRSTWLTVVSSLASSAASQPAPVFPSSAPSPPPALAAAQAALASSLSPPPGVGMASVTRTSSGGSGSGEGEGARAAVDALFEALETCNPETRVTRAVREGYLTKRGRLNFSFRRRFFVLTLKGQLRYYDDRTYRGTILLSKLKRVEVRTERRFDLVTRYRTYALMAATADDAAGWVTALTEGTKESVKVVEGARDTDFEI